MRKDPVTIETRLFVMGRDLEQMWLHSEDLIHHGVSRRKYLAVRRIICVAPMLDPSQSGTCWGRSTLEHVKDDLRMGRRAPSDAAHLVTLCQGHTEDGRTAGRQWNTDKRNRERVRDYLRRYGRVEEGADDADG